MAKILVNLLVKRFFEESAPCLFRTYISFQPPSCKKSSAFLHETTSILLVILLFGTLGLSWTRIRVYGLTHLSKQNHGESGSETLVNTQASWCSLLQGVDERFRQHLNKLFSTRLRLQISFFSEHAALKPVISPMFTVVNF
jgi:hypothetical protein